MSANEFNKIADISLNHSNSRVQIVTEGGAPFNEVLKVVAPGIISNANKCGSVIIHLFDESNHKVAFPVQYEDQLPEGFEDDDIGLYDITTLKHTIKINAEGITIKSSNILIDRDDGQGPKPIALVGDITSDGAVVLGAGS